MGGNNSKEETCGEPYDCEVFVDRVARECDAEGSKALDTTLTNSISTILPKGPKNSAQTANYTSILQQLNGNAAAPDWDGMQPTVVANTSTISPFTNYEGFKEGASKIECVECDCAQAAEKIIADCKAISKKIPNKTTKIIGDNMLRKDVADAMNSRDNEKTKQKPVPKTFEWDTVFSPGIIPNSKIIPDSNSNSILKANNEPFNNKEAFDNNGISVYKFIQDAIQARHAKFKDTGTFGEDCKNSSYYSMRKFITDEKLMLDKLHNYYTTFVNNYESLFLQKETVSKVINSKVEELDKIQRKIDSYKTNLHVDNRKNNYQNNNYEFYKYINKYILIAYYSLFILYLIFSNLFSERLYTNKKLLVVLLLYLIIPVILSYSINITYEGYIYFLEYYNLKEDTKSYADIIKLK
jgi:hypothetical protein